MESNAQIVKPIHPEARLSEAATQWLSAQGLVVYAEAPCRGGFIDLVGWDQDEKLIAIELKLSLGIRVIRQANRNQACTIDSYAAVPTTPNNHSLNRAKNLGIGVLQLNDEPGATVLVKPYYHQSWKIQKSHRRALLTYCRKAVPGGVGGLPNQIVRPAETCHGLIIVYILAHPKATWTELFERIPSHYKHVKSMYSSMHLYEKINNSSARIGTRPLYPEKQETA